MDSKAIKTYLFEAILNFSNLVDQGKIEVEQIANKQNSGSLFNSSIMLEPFLVIYYYSELCCKDSKPSLFGGQEQGS